MDTRINKMRIYSYSYRILKLSEKINQNLDIDCMIDDIKAMRNVDIREISEYMKAIDISGKYAENIVKVTTETIDFITAESFGKKINMSWLLKEGDMLLLETKHHLLLGSTEDYLYIIKGGEILKVNN